MLLKYNGVYTPQRTEKETFDLKTEDVTVEIISRSRVETTASVTHHPTGIVVWGHDPEFPGSTLSAKRVALRNLMGKLEELNAEQQDKEQDVV